MHSIRVLDGKTVDGIVASLPAEGIIHLMRRVFKTLVSEVGVQDLACPPRTSLQSSNHTTLFMPSRIASAGGTGVKIVSVPKSGTAADGLPATTLMMNEESGAVEAVINARQLTAVRNAAGLHL